MTLRDYFAAKAMQAMITVTIRTDVKKELLSDAAYEIADAMLEARQK